MRIPGLDRDNESLSPQLIRTGTQPSASLPAASSSAAEKSPRLVTKAVLASDSSVISSTASLVSRTMSLPEVNAGRVAALQQSLAAGTFEIDSSRTATAVIQTMLNQAWS